MIIQHNLASMGAFRQSKITTARKAKTSERLASGYRINQAPDTENARADPRPGSGK